MIHECLTYCFVSGLNFAGSSCTDTDPKANVPYPILPAEPGSLLSLIPPEIQPPAEAPAAPLEAKDVVDPPLPPVAKINHAADAPAETTPSSALANAANVGLSLAVTMVLGLLSWGC